MQVRHPTIKLVYSFFQGNRCWSSFKWLRCWYRSGVAVGLSFTRTCLLPEPLLDAHACRKHSRKRNACRKPNEPHDQTAPPVPAANRVTKALGRLPRPAGHRHTRLPSVSLGTVHHGPSTRADRRARCAGRCFRRGRRHKLQCHRRLPGRCCCFQTFRIIVGQRVRRADLMRCPPHGLPVVANPCSQSSSPVTRHPLPLTPLRCARHEQDPAILWRPTSTPPFFCGAPVASSVVVPPPKPPNPRNPAPTLSSSTQLR